MKTTVIRNVIRRQGYAATGAIIAAVLACCFASTGTAQIVPMPILSDQLLAKAAPDECFAGIGKPYPPLQAGGTCPAGSIPKRNQAYVWGLTQVGTQLWFGTAANVICVTTGGNPQPYQTPDYVCEYGASQYGKEHNLPPSSGDWRPPKAFLYDLSSSTLTDMTPTNEKFTHTLGIRSAQAIGNRVFLAGPAIGGPGVNFFVFSSSSKEFLGACHASAFDNIRHWAVINNVLYAGVGNTGGGGGVIRWTGTDAQPFDETSPTCGFEVVGNFKGAAEYITAYGANSNRIVVSAWPSTGGGAGLYISTAMNPAVGLTSADVGSWAHIWWPEMYEPDPVTAKSYGGGAIVYWNGALYFGTMHQVGGGVGPFLQAYGYSHPYTEVFQGTSRALTLWQILNAETKTPTITLLYGETALETWDTSTNTFQLAPTGWTPLYGPSGFGNLYNNYAWTAGVFQNRLFYGTEDWSFDQTINGDPPPAPGHVQPADAFGADLWRFDMPNAPAIAENIDGLGNSLNYGVRSMNVSPDGQDLVLGTANPMNIAPQGGWELRLLQLMQ
jgi:hypothetical protein